MSFKKFILNNLIVIGIYLASATAYMVVTGDINTVAFVANVLHVILFWGIWPLYLFKRIKNKFSKRTLSIASAVVPRLPDLAEDTTG